jgi:hypothetical protein
MLSSDTNEKFFRIVRRICHFVAGRQSVSQLMVNKYNTQDNILKELKMGPAKNKLA